MSNGRSDLSRRSVVGGIVWTSTAAVAGCEGGSGSSPPAPPPPIKAAFPLTRVTGVRHLVDASGNAFMMMGDAAWSLIAQLSREDAVTYLTDRQARGFNAVLVSLIEHKFTSHAPANFYGVAPFTTPGDFSTPNEAYFDHAEYVIQQAENRGILVLLAPAYIGAGGGNEGWYGEMQASGAAKMRAYGQYLATRFAGLKNILWVQAGDWNPTDRTGVQALANGIREVNPSALQTAHCDVNTTALGVWENESWLSTNNVYTRASIYSAVEAEYQKSEQMPVFFIEGTYENENYGAGVPTEQDLRKEAFHALLSGAFGHVFGNNPIWHFDGPGLFDAPYYWKKAMSGRGSQSMTYVRKVLDQAGWGNLVPDLAGQFLVSGAGSGETRAVASVTSNGSAAVVYLPTRRAISINLARLSGPKVSLFWYDPSSGVQTAIDAAPFDNTGVRSLKPPGANKAGFRDWVLFAESVV